MKNEILPVLDTEKLQEKANEYAQKGAEETIKDFYSGYNSPYRKAIEENLKNKGVDSSFEIPDIVASINEKLSQQVDEIANTAIAKTFIPFVKEFLSREEADIKFSDILRKFIEETDFKYNDDIDWEDFESEKIVDDSKSYRSSFFEYRISNGKVGYELRFYKKSDDKIEITSLPYKLNESGRYDRGHVSKEVMKLSFDGGATLELPFTKGVLEDRFTAYIARLVIGGNNIIFDVEEFEEDMFPNDHCHCD